MKRSLKVREMNLRNRSVLSVFAVLIAPLVLIGCVRLTIAWADLEPKGPPAHPPIVTSENSSLAKNVAFRGVQEKQIHWETIGAATARRELQEHVYGYLPERSSTRVGKKTVLDRDAYNGKGQLEEIVLRADATFGDETRTTKPFSINVAYPKNADGPVPLILAESFTPRWMAMGHDKVSQPGDEDRSMPPAFLRSVLLFVFGRYVATSPVEEILDKGYAFAVLYPGEYVPDEGETGLAALKNLAEGHADEDTRWGAIGAWAWGFSRAIDALYDDPRLSKQAIVTYGHSRYGKSALLAAAFDPRISGVIAHQSGTGGASLSKYKKGESIQSITETYPHWFSRKYASYANRENDMPVDQHHLLALSAPRPIFLGNARRDVWSDPNGALKAAIGADPIWKLYAANGGLQQQELKPFIPSADISIWLRPGTHGVVKEDWPAFLSFMEAHFGQDTSGQKVAPCNDEASIAC